MKILAGIICVAVLIAALVLYILIMLNSRDLVFCGDITQVSGQTMYVTRVYTSDLNANETLSEIVSTMNEAETASISAEEMTEILATYQDIIYAPMFVFSLEQEDEHTYVLTGNVYNGLDENGEPTSPDFMYKNLMLTTGVVNGKILAAQNVYSDDLEEDSEPEFKERRKVIDPVLIDDETGAAFVFNDFNSFRMIITGSEGYTTSVTLAFTYDVVAENPLNFTRESDAIIGVTITAAYDEDGIFTPEIKVERNIILSEDNG